MCNAPSTGFGNLLATDARTRRMIEERLLDRAGRQSDALAVHRETPELLREELGLEPSRALQELELAILRHDRGLEHR